MRLSFAVFPTVFLRMRPAGSLPAGYTEPGAEVGIETCCICGTHPADGGSIILGQPAVARCPEPTAGQVNNVGSKKYMKCFSQSRL
jgi:hypothetical protein